MWAEPAELFLAANSARAIAESAVRGGFRVQILDGFCDQDTQGLGSCTRVPMIGWGLDPVQLSAAIERLAIGPSPVGLVYGAGLESSPDLLSALPEPVQLLGNAPAVLALLADPVRLFALLTQCAIPHPQTRLDPPSAGNASLWLLKECGGSGGLGVRLWRDGDPRPSGPHYFQQRLAGALMSVLFIADGARLEVIGFNHLLVADGGAQRPFLYGGAIGQAIIADPLRQVVIGWAASLVAALGLRGLNNLDFILHQGRAYLLELNARPSATMSLYEGQCAEGWISRHVRACLGTLPAASWAPPAGIRGQRLVYAPADLRIPVDLVWPAWCRDRSPAGTLVPRGAPLCTVLADGPATGSVESLLAVRAQRMLDLIGEHETHE